MLLKRIYKKGTDEVDYLSIGHTGTTRNQNFSSELVMKFITDGFATLDKDYFILRAYPEDLRYSIIRVPGRYCLHCGIKLEDDASGESARDHVQSQHPGAESPDPLNPLGYEVLNHFETMLDSDQHEKFMKMDPARGTVFPRKES